VVTLADPDIRLRGPHQWRYSARGANLIYFPVASLTLISSYWKTKAIAKLDEKPLPDFPLPWIGHSHLVVKGFAFNIELK